MKLKILCLLLSSGLSPSLLWAAENPFDGYSSTLSYNLHYTGGTSFAPVNIGNSTDVRAGISIAGKEHLFNVDTGSRGLYVALEELQDGTEFTIKVPGAYAGQIGKPGSIVMDSGIGYSFLSDPDLTPGETLDKVTVYLMNSGGLVGYNINVNDPENKLSPTEIKVVPPTTTGVYSQGQDPFRTQFFNTGRDVFEGFDMLYDASNGFMGVKPNEHGLNDPNIFFTAQQGGFPNPIPEPSTYALLLIGALAVLVSRDTRRRACATR